MIAPNKIFSSFIVLALIVTVGLSVIDNSPGAVTSLTVSPPESEALTSTVYVPNGSCDWVTGVVSVQVPSDWNGPAENRSENGNCGSQNSTTRGRSFASSRTSSAHR